MGWSRGINTEGRAVGYSVQALCDQEGCDVKIDRGLYYVCGGMHDGDEHGCGGYFCGNHLAYYCDDDEADDPETVQLCDKCGIEYELGDI
jgi:hypothetical protein